MIFHNHHLIAHRGLHHHDGGIPENSLPAFQKALEQGHGIEIDVRLTADGIPIVFHDRNARRMTGKGAVICRTAWAELEPLRLLDTDCGIPTLAQVLSLVQGAVPLIIELKSGFYYGRLPVLVQKLLEDYQGSYCVQSFHPGIVWWYKKNAPTIPRGLLGGGRETLKTVKDLVFTPIALNYILKPNFCAYHIDQLTPRQVKVWKSQGREVAAWTVITEAQMQKAQALCDGIIYETHPKACE